MAASNQDEKLMGHPPHSWHLRLRQDGSSSREDLVEALSQALLAADPRIILRNTVKVRWDEFEIGELSFKFSEFRRVLVIGGGKATAGMAQEIEQILDGWITAGAVNIPTYTKPWPKSSRIHFNPANHPIPSQEGVQGVEDMLELVGKPSEKDLVICLISGGGSALMPLPSHGLTLSDKQKTTKLLLKSGARIDEINTVRKHLSETKGGRLAEKLYPAKVVSLIISDVVGDKLEFIASGPTVPDDTTYSDAYNVLKRHGLWRKAPESVGNRIQQGMEGTLPETPKPGSHVFNRVHNLVIANNKQSCSAAARVLLERGYHTAILSTPLQGEARKAGRDLSRTVCDIRKNQIPVAPPAAIIAGGETTVTVHGKGRGGRNQELVLSAARSIQRIPNTLVSSIGTDGIDGPTTAAGAVADSTTLKRSHKLGLDPDTFLRENDSYRLFKKLDDLIITGPTGTNVNDIAIAIVEAQEQKHERKHDS